MDLADRGTGWVSVQVQRCLNPYHGCHAGCEDRVSDLRDKEGRKAGACGHLCQHTQPILVAQNAIWPQTGARCGLERHERGCIPCTQHKGAMPASRSGCAMASTSPAFALPVQCCQYDALSACCAIQKDALLWPRCTPLLRSTSRSSPSGHAASSNASSGPTM